VEGARRRRRRKMMRRRRGVGLTQHYISKVYYAHRPVTRVAAV